MSAAPAFVFSANGQAVHRVRTLRQFVSQLEQTASHHLTGYIVRGDFSRWIGDVFGDRALADELRRLEQRYRNGVREETVPAIAKTGDR